MIETALAFLRQQQAWLMAPASQSTWVKCSPSSGLASFSVWLSPGDSRPAMLTWCTDLQAVHSNHQFMFCPFWLTAWDICRPRLQNNPGQGLPADSIYWLQPANASAAVLHFVFPGAISQCYLGGLRQGAANTVYQRCEDLIQMSLMKMSCKSQEQQAC